ncbi:NO-inducible flavohemoprotein [Dyadobacter subterraneus]|uniref:nitric oxide dioxygenase n=1 Tax=Dyadobacter subterraneus TaxID=2773304 RepID=A0ABR9W7B2_9BACT|nr:NO-inducible flavohemoprotein [Dyadobacter subterraneus]MBE9461352.1 NO-inducible flavohemoprotein [Dyadobacter subterraneus]
MTTDQKNLIKATVPVLKENGVLLTDYFYKRMFKGNPELKNVFNMANQQNSKQQTALAMAILAYAENIENPAILMPAIDGISQKHISLDIRPEHYIIVGKHLLASISEVLGEAATPEILDAWEVAYNQLASIMSGHESTLYSKQVQKKGGWSGWKPFIINEKIVESAEITSFHLYPADQGSVADFIPGQYISIRLFIPELNLLQPRQYSISSAPNGEYYRISVKKEGLTRLNPDGMISNRLHDFLNAGDIVEVSAPAGNFTLNPKGDHPVVFISGGVGQTPLISMLENLIQSGSNRPKTWIHGCRDEKVHAFKDVIDNWADGQQDFHRHTFYDRIDNKHDFGNTYEGWVDLNKFDNKILPENADYYICGPSPFIAKHYKDLVERGIKKQAIHFEEFGPQTLQL